MCKFYKVSRSGYYKWLLIKDNDTKDEIIANLIREIHARSNRTFGYRRIKVCLMKEQGLIINEKAVLRIMRKYNILSVIRQKRAFASYEYINKYENLLNRGFDADAPNTKWLTDVTYIRTSQGFLYCSAIKDCFDGSIVNANLSKYNSVGRSEEHTSELQSQG